MNRRFELRRPSNWWLAGQEVLDVHAPHLVGLGAGGMSHGRLADPRQGVEACEEGLGLFGLR